MYAFLPLPEEHKMTPFYARAVLSTAQGSSPQSAKLQPQLHMEQRAAAPAGPNQPTQAQQMQKGAPPPPPPATAMTCELCV